MNINKSKNRLYCTLIGPVSKDDVNGIFEDICSAVGDLRPNFSVVNDLTQCSYGQIAGIPALQKLMQYLITHGVKDVVRVVNNKSLIYSQFTNLNHKFQAYAPVYVLSLEEAEKFLDEKATRQHIRFNVFNKVAELNFKGQNYQGALVDLSLGGCAIRSDIDTVSEGDEIKLTFSLLDNQGKDNQFVIKTVVARLAEDSFAVHFTSLMPSVLTKLKECMALCILEGKAK